MAFSKSQVGYMHSFGVLDRILNTQNNNVFNFRNLLSDLRMNDQLALIELVKFHFKFTLSIKYIFYSDSKLFVNKQSNILLQEIAHKRINWFNSTEVQNKLKIKLPIAKPKRMFKNIRKPRF